MILPITHISDWKAIRLQIYTLIDNNNKQDNRIQLDHDHRSSDQFLIINEQAFKYKTPYKGLYTIVQTCTKGSVMF